MQSVESKHRAAAPRTPEPSLREVRALAEVEMYRAEREGIERRSMVRGLILLAVVVLAGSIARAGLDRVFVHGWWRF